MAIEIQTPPIIIRVGSYALLPPGDLTPAEVQELKADIQAEQNKALDDLTDVTTAGAAEGDTLVRNAAGVWEPGQTTGMIERVSTNWDPVTVENVNHLTFGPGLAVDPSFGSPRAHVVPQFGTTNTTIARGNHTHAIRVDTQLTFNASGSFSSGTRTLVAGNVTGLDTTKTYVLKGVLDVHLRGDGAGAGYTRPRITINGNAVDMPERPRNVAGVQPCYTMRHPGVTVSGVSSVAVSATIAYSEGDATWVGGGALTISIEANR